MFSCSFYGERQFLYNIVDKADAKEFFLWIRTYMDQTYMKQKPVLPLVVSMALPMTLSMFVNSLYNIVDSIFIAK